MKALKAGLKTVWVLFFFAASLTVKAQWLTQNITVTNGWTAAYLFVDASSQPILPTTPNLPIGPGNPIDQIWLWQVPASTAQYVSSPLSPLTGSGRWISWNITNSQNALASLVGNAAYLIHSSGNGTYSWSIQGQPVPPHYVWDLTGLNLVGFSTPTLNPPNFASFFAQDPAMANVVQIFQYPGGPFTTQQLGQNPAPVIFPNSTPVNRGQAYWIGASNVNNVYFGPFQVNLADPSGIAYGATGGQSTFHLVNITPNALTVHMSLLPSEAPPFGQTPIVGAPPLLLEGALNSTNLTYAYTAINGATSSWTLPPYGQPGSDIAVVVGVNRFAMAGTNGTLYAGILQFTDSLGFSQLNVPVSANVSDDTGLWVGTANINQVSYDLKSYATNSDGSYVSSLVTNQVVSMTTNGASSLGAATNWQILQSAVTNQVTTYYTVTNLVINTYTSNTTTISSNGFVISTNYLVGLGYTTNTDITTTVTGYYFTNNGALLVWETDSATNYLVDTLPMSTNQVIITNQIALVPSNGTPVLVTNDTIFTYLIQNEITTNAIFSLPVTNVLSSTSFTLTNEDITTNFAYDAMATNVISEITTMTNASALSNYDVTTNIGSITLTTNAYPASYLYVFTNPPNLISVSVMTNISEVTIEISPVYTTNGYIINNNFAVTSTDTNLVSSVTNQVFTTSVGLQGVPAFAFTTNISLNFTTNPYVVLTTNALVSSVSNYVVSAYNTNLDSVVAPYPLRLIVFSGANGACSLLQRVYYGLRQNTNLVVATTESVLDVSHLNVARRITATQLPWVATNAPWAFSGGPLAQGGTYTASIVEPYDDQAANPYLHTYHPDHNNLDTESPPRELPMGSDSYEIDRTITLTLPANTNDFIGLTTANSSLSGNYYETISLKGLAGYAKTYHTAGTFALKRISPISTLTTR